MQQQIDDLINHLNEFKDFAVSLDDIEKQHEIAKAELEKTNLAVNDAKTDLSKLQSGLTVAQLASVKEHDQAIFDRRKELEDLAVRIDQAKSHFNELTVAANSAAERHHQIEASIESLRKRLG